MLQGVTGEGDKVGDVREGPRWQWSAVCSLLGKEKRLVVGWKGDQKGKRDLVVQLLIGAIPGSVPAHGVSWRLKGCYCMTDLWVQMGEK